MHALRTPFSAKDLKIIFPFDAVDSKY